MTKSAYSYRVTLTPTGVPNEGVALRPPFSFDATCHDDIITIVERARASTGLDPDAAAAMAVGLKLLGEVVLREKHNTLFDPLRGGIRDFIGGLKALGRGDVTP
jgi:hypothetical protein